MKSYEMVESLSTKTGVSLELAKEALEKSNWDILDAAVYLERLQAGVSDNPNSNSSTQQQPAQNGAYYVSGRLTEVNGSFATPGPGTEPTTFNRPYGYDSNYTPPYKNFPNQGANYSSEYENQSIGQAVGVLAGFLEKIINAIFSNYVIVTRKDKEIFRLHLIPTLILCIAFGALSIPVIILSLAFECKYSLGQKKTDKTFTDVIDNTVNSVWQTAQQAKDTIVTETKVAAQNYENTRKEFVEDYRKGRASVNLKKDI